ncbi:glucosaminidase domain-containing protein [Flavicella sp.]|uniref:glucosaminidase domain-containing protein n=1 Tax=Flavicella sp. TaxID=2957742 RepID=UPI0030184F7B
MNKILGVLVISIFIISCGSSKKTTTTKRTPKPVLEIIETDNKDVNKEIVKLERRKASLNTRTIAYISHYASVAMHEMKKHKVPASITLAQGILESGNGVSNLALKSNNHFGIKCHNRWHGESVRHDDDEKQECFRKYKHVESSYRDHSLFLTGGSRYDFLFDLKIDDYKGWAKGLKKAGYATDKKYPGKLIRLVETYDLDHYDKLVLDKKIKDDKVISNKKRIGKAYRVRKGDTLYAIAKRYRMKVNTIKELNDLTSNEISINQILKLE